MAMKITQIALLLLVQMLCSAKCENVSDHGNLNVTNRQAKDLYYHHSEADGNPAFTYPSGFHSCPTNTVSDFFGRQLNFVLFKIGAVAVVKAIVIVWLLLKIPLFFLKLVFLKSFWFPVLIAPFLLHLYASQSTPVTTMVRPSDGEQSSQTGGGMGRILEEDLSTRMWRSLKTFVESDQCVERFACTVGAYNKESFSGETISRALKLFERSSPIVIQKRLSSVREAFKQGARNGSCADEDFVCHGPGLFLQYGSDKTQLL